MEAEVKEHEKLERSSRRVGLQREHRGQKKAYRHIVEHLKEIVG